LLLCVAVVLVGFAAFMVAATLYPRALVSRAHAINFCVREVDNSVKFDAKFKFKLENLQGNNH